ncbi:MAG TPA: hypothetical protein VFY88_06070 [Intrasporangium sp.]|nr:hypothetical protein [Intrasporangium sp.]
MDLALIARDSVFPLSRALSAGIGPDELSRRLRAGECHRLHHGWFTTVEPSDDTTRHRLRTVALLEQYQSKAVASHSTALLRLELPTYEPHLPVVHLMATDPMSRGHRKADLLVHPRPGAPLRSRRVGRSSRRTPEGEQVGGRSEIGSAMAALPDTSGGTTHPALAIALAGLADPRAFLVPADAALGKGLVTPDDLAGAVTVLGARPGIHRVRAALKWCDPRHESPGETVAGFVLRSLGYRVVPQVVVPGTGQWTPAGEGYRADFGIVGTTVLIEFDGRVKYASGDALWVEKQREDRIRGIGYEVVRLTWADLRDPERVRGLVDAAIRRAARRT